MIKVLALVCFICNLCTASGQASWKAHWIAAPWSGPRDGAELDGSRPLPVFQREVYVRKGLTSAEFRIAGLGQWQAEISGSSDATPVGGRGLHQAWTDYRKTVTYEKYDVTTMLKPGASVLRVMLGNGMYNVQHTTGRYTKFEGSFGAPALTAELRLNYTDGTRDVILTDDSWKVARGPVSFASTYGGEDFDARKLLPGTSDAGWSRAVIVDGPGGALRPAIAPEVAEAETHMPVKSTVINATTSVYDLGKNFAGVPVIRVHGPSGALLKLIPGELLNADGTVSQASSGGPMWWTYTLRGDTAGESWRPMFGYYGFRYLQAEWTASDGLQTKPELDAIAGVEWHSDSRVTGTFESSNAMLNSIHQLIVAAMHNNEVSLFTDCPHREKLGWLEETHLVAPGLIFNNDLQDMFRATDLNMADAQYNDGTVPTIAPQYTKFAPKYAIYDDSPEWGSASILAPWTAFRFYGDAAQLAEDYPTMQRYLTYLENKAKDGIVAYGLGDWYDIGPGGPGFEKNTSLGVTGTLMLYEDARAMQKIAVLLNHDDDAQRYGVIAKTVAAAFQARFWNAAAGWYDTGSQTANAMPLALGIVPAENHAAVLAHVIADIHAHQDHVTTGEVGYPYLVRALTEAGRSDVLYAMLMRKDPPSYGSQLAAGATALTEAWDANPRSSQDHFMLGGAEEWFYRGLAGIDIDLSRADPVERITIRPRMVKGVTWVKCGYDSKLGRIESDWTETSVNGTMTVTIPEGQTATVYVPSARMKKRMAGATFLRGQDGESVYKVHAGVHRFIF